MGLLDLHLPVGVHGRALHGVPEQAEVADQGAAGLPLEHVVLLPLPLPRLAPGPACDDRCCGDLLVTPGVVEIYW